jgi:hypothetical protein
LDESKELEPFLAVAQTISLQAMELAPEQRSAFIHRAVTAIHLDYAAKHGADPSTAEMAERLETITATLVEMIEASGGSLGHA